MDKINRLSKLPVYQQLYDIFRKKIDNREWDIGDMLPTEKELMETYGVSRNTVRDVLDKLTNKGLIYRKRALGTFVAQPTVEQGLVRIINFTEDMENRGLTPSSSVLSSKLIPASLEIANKLQIAEGEELAYLRRLRLANNEPMSIEDSFFVHRYCPGLLSRHDYAAVSLRKAMADDYNIHWLHASQVIRAIAGSRETTKLLGIPTHSPMLFIERISYSQDDIPIEFLQISYRGDRYSLHNELNA